MFCSVTSSGWPGKSLPNSIAYALNSGSIDWTLYSMPSARASASASALEWSDETALGIETPRTLSGPSASAAMTATSAESMPPESPTTAFLKPHLVA